MKSVWPSLPARVVAPRRLPKQPEPPKIKVLHVITRFVAGSGGNTLVSAVDIDRDRYETWVAGMPGGPLWEQAEAAGVRTVHLSHMRERISPLHDVLTCLELVRLMRRERFSVVHTHSAKAGVSGRVAAKVAGVPVVVHTFHALAAHPGLSPRARLVYLLLERAVRRLAHRYVAVAPRLARQAVEQKIAPPGTVVVVPSAVDLDHIPVSADPEVRAELGIPEDVPVVGTVGRLVAQKCPLDFVRMCSLVHAQRPDARFVMVGDATLETGDLEDLTRREAERLGVPVIFTGYRKDAPRVAAAFDVYVVPSLYEGLGRAVTEAMAAARPVVATAVNGVPDLVEPGVTGLLAAPQDPEGLASAVMWMLDHPVEARQMGLQARQRVLSHFGREEMCHGLDELYAELLGLPAPAEPAQASQNGRAEHVPHLLPASAAQNGRQWDNPPIDVPSLRRRPEAEAVEHT
ncbi:MAG TPA: glycosyltransferase family 4 protein [Nocardioidaceae bacterium]|nr:glycosyltransferase family 4 protein [Nocardioidaceae bacterium]